MSRALLGKPLYDITMQRWLFRRRQLTETWFSWVWSRWCHAEIDALWPLLSLLVDPERDRTARFGAKMSDNANHCHKSR